MEGRSGAFMDLSGAYDSVDRNLLFTKLEGLGMAAHSISTLRSLYEATQCIVKAHQGTHAPFQVGCGLRQGCPLSTTLFNLFIWDLHARLAQTGAGALCTHGARQGAAHRAEQHVWWGGRRCRSIKLPVAGGREFNRAVCPRALGLTGAALPRASVCALAGASRCFTGRAAQPGTKRG